MTGAPDATSRETRAADAPAVIYLPDASQPAAPKRKGRSGSENRQRTTAIRVRLHPADAERLRREAADAGLSLAGYLAQGRLGAESAVRPRARQRPPAVDELALMRALAAFSRVHSNLNQIAHALNRLALFAEEWGAARVLDELDTLRRPVEGLREQFAAPLAAISGAVWHDREG